MQTVTKTKTSTMTFIVVGVALAAGGAIAAAALSTDLPSISLPARANISISTTWDDSSTFDYRAGDEKTATVTIKNNGSKTANTVTATIASGVPLIESGWSTMASSSGVKAYGCTTEYYIHDFESNPNTSTLPVYESSAKNTTTCNFDIPAGGEAKVKLSYRVDGAFAECGKDSNEQVDVTATATYANDPDQSNNMDRETLEIEMFSCPEVSIDVSLDDTSAMTKEDMRTVTVAVTNLDDTLNIWYVPISIFAQGGLYMNDIPLEDIREDDDTSYSYYSYQFNSLDQTFVPVYLDPGETETVETKVFLLENAVACDTTAEAAILAGVASRTDSDMSNNTDSVTVTVQGETCE